MSGRLLWVVWSLFFVLGGNAGVFASTASAAHVLIHMKTALSVDDAQICAVPNVAWAAVEAGHKVTILIDGSAVTSVTKGYGFFRGILGSDTSALDRAGLPEGERQSLSEQMGRPLEQIPHNYGEYIDFLRSELDVAIYGNRTMMALYKIDPKPASLGRDADHAG